MSSGMEFVGGPRPHAPHTLLCEYIIFYDKFIWRLIFIYTLQNIISWSILYGIPMFVNEYQALYSDTQYYPVFSHG